MIIAVDFDGVIVEDRFPEIGVTDFALVNVLKELHTRGHELILWTCRVDDRLKDAIEWCKTLDIPFDEVNGPTLSNLEKYGSNPRKVYADIYLDDRSAGYNRDNTMKVLYNILKEK